MTSVGAAIPNVGYLIASYSTPLLLEPPVYKGENQLEEESWQVNGGEQQMNWGSSPRPSFLFFFKTLNRA